MARPTRFETWKEPNGAHACHLRSGSKVLWSTHGYNRVREAKNLYRITISRNAANTTYHELDRPWRPKVKKARRPKHFEGKLNRNWP